MAVDYYSVFRWILQRLIYGYVGGIWKGKGTMAWIDDGNNKMMHVSPRMGDKGTYSKMLRKHKENGKGSFFEIVRTQMNFQSARNRNQRILYLHYLKEGNKTGKKREVKFLVC